MGGPMRYRLGAILIGAVILQTSAGLARAQDEEGAGRRPGVIVARGSAGPGIAPPVFASTYGPSNGYGYAPATYAPASGKSLLAIWSYYDGTISSPFRPGSINLMPPLGYTSTG